MSKSRCIKGSRRCFTGKCVTNVSNKTKNKRGTRKCANQKCYPKNAKRIHATTKIQRAYRNYKIPKRPMTGGGLTLEEKRIFREMLEKYDTIKFTNDLIKVETLRTNILKSIKECDLKTFKELVQSNTNPILEFWLQDRQYGTTDHDVDYNEGVNCIENEICPPGQSLQPRHASHLIKEDIYSYTGNISDFHPTESQVNNLFEMLDHIDSRIRDEINRPNQLKDISNFKKLEINFTDKPQLTSKTKVLGNPDLSGYIGKLLHPR